MKEFLIVLFIVLGVYLLIILLNIVFVISFYIIMKKHDKAVKIILKSKLDSLNNLKKLMIEKWNLHVDEELIKLLDEVETTISKKNYILECDEAKKKLSYVKTNLSSVCDEHKEVTETDEYVLIIENVTQLDSIYRSHVIMYNADVLGYNYWIRFLPCRYIWLLLRFKTKSFIS